MNIFYLHANPVKAAMWHNDKHCVKMILETAQMLCTAHWENGSEAPYRKTHVNHPSSIWARSSEANYRWLCRLGLALCKEYTARYGRRHKTQDHMEWLIANIPNLPKTSFTQPPQAMPDQYKQRSAVKAYRAYYMGEKAHIANWKRNKPYWFKENLTEA